MSEEEKRTMGQVIYDMVHLWSNIADGNKIRDKVHRWTKAKHKPTRKD